MIFHGGRLDDAIERFGGARSEWLDLSTGINRNPYPIRKIASEVLQNLPDKAAEAKLISNASAYFGVKEKSEIVAANGTQAIIQLLPSILDVKHVAIFSPTYGEHAHCWKNADVAVQTIAFRDAIPASCDCLVMVNPNNPTNHTFSLSEIEAIADALNQKGGWLIVDEAFGDSLPELSATHLESQNVIVLKSFGKFFGLAGVRLGFAIGAKSIMEKLSEKIGPWAVSGPALQIGARAYQDICWINANRKKLQKLSSTQEKALGSIEFAPISSNALFQYFNRQNASKIFEGLANRKILVRDFPEQEISIRFGICANDDELSRLILGLEEVMRDV